MTIEQTIEIPSDHRLVLELPYELPIGRARVELTVTPEKKESIADGKSAFGCLHQFASPLNLSGEKGAWSQAVIEKYAQN
jgi:hypothetical protein